MTPRITPSSHVRIHHILFQPQPWMIEKQKDFARLEVKSHLLVKNLIPDTLLYYNYPFVFVFRVESNYSNLCPVIEDSHQIVSIKLSLLLPEPNPDCILLLLENQFPRLVFL